MTTETERRRHTELPDRVRDQLEACWSVVTTKPKRFVDGWSIDNAPDYYRLEQIVQRWAVATGGEEALLGTEPEIQQSLDLLTERVFSLIHTEVIEWASTRTLDLMNRREQASAG